MSKERDKEEEGGCWSTKGFGNNKAIVNMTHQGKSVLEKRNDKQLKKNISKLNLNQKCILLEWVNF